MGDRTEALLTSIHGCQNEVLRSMEDLGYRMATFDTLKRVKCCYHLSNMFTSNMYHSMYEEEAEVASTGRTLVSVR